MLDYGDGLVCESSRGILMGLPLTWISLSLLQLFWSRDLANTSRPAPNFIICGDDLLALWPQK